MTITPETTPRQLLEDLNVSRYLSPDQLDSVTGVQITGEKEWTVYVQFCKDGGIKMLRFRLARAGWIPYDWSD